MMIFGVGLEMLSQIINPLGQDRNLHFRRACISLVSFKRADNLSFPFFRQHDSSILLNLFGKPYYIVLVPLFATPVS
jgi:hypothetical protein